MRHGGRRTFWTKDQGIAALQQLAKELGRTPTSREMGAGCCPSTKWFLDRFGSIAGAQRAAGLRPSNLGRHGGIEPRFRVPDIDPARAAELTAAKQSYWSQKAQGLHGLAGWTHPYARKSA